MGSNISRISNLALFLILTSACTPHAIEGWDYRNGPNPGMPYKDRVKPHLKNENEIMNAFRESAVNGGGYGGGKSAWYYAAVEGFNFIDAECDQYLDELYALDHGRDRFKSAVDSTGLLVNAIMATDPSSKVAMAIVTQAFGLASKYVDTFANSYLYSGHSSTVKHVVDTMQDEYRRKVDPSAVTSSPEAYHSIRGYLELCLPPTIEAKIDSALQASTATAEPNKNEPNETAGAAPLISLRAGGAAE